MSQIVHKMKKVLNGCMHKSNHKYFENDMNNPIIDSEFKFESPELHMHKKTAFPIYNDYDNLDHTGKKKNVLRDSTNIEKRHLDSNNNNIGGFKKRFLKSSSSKKLDQNNGANYSHIYESQIENTNENGIYCEINNENIYEEEPLIDLTQLNETEIKNKSMNESRIIEKESLTDLRSPDSFKNEDEGFHWYLNLLNEHIVNCIKTDKTLNEANRSKRLAISKAHFLYVRNFYEMKISNSKAMKQKLVNFHPCHIVLACLFDSEAVKIEESHLCVCDTYIYLFATRLKYCAWKSKLFILLKKPKRSSFDRLNLIEDLMNCHKLIQS